MSRTEAAAIRESRENSRVSSLIWSVRFDRSSSWSWWPHPFGSLAGSDDPRRPKKKFRGSRTWYPTIRGSLGRIPGLEIPRTWRLKKKFEYLKIQEFSRISKKREIRGFGDDSSDLFFRSVFEDLHGSFSLRNFYKLPLYITINELT